MSLPPSPARPAEALALLRRLALASFVQMLPATLLSPAIRPLVAAQHGGAEAVMQAFLAVNMLGAAAFIVLFAPRLDALADDRRWLAPLLLLDAVLLALLPFSVPTPLFLAARFLEGAVHVGASTLLLARAAALGRIVGPGRAMGLAGGSVALAVGLGSGLGGALLRWGGLPAPFLAGAVLAVLALGLGHFRVTAPATANSPATDHLRLHTLGYPLAAAFIGRFTVGLLVVSFALFAHRRHDASDAAIGALFTLLTLPFALGTYPAARVAGRLGSQRVGAVGALLFGGALALLDTVPTAGLGALLVAAGLGAAFVYASALRSAAAPAERLGRARVMGLVNVAGCVGMAAGPLAALAVGALAEAAGGPRQEAVFSFGAVVLALFAGWSWLQTPPAVEAAPRLDGGQGASG